MISTIRSARGGWSFVQKGLLMKAVEIKNERLTSFFGLNGSNKCTYVHCDILTDNGRYSTVYLELDSEYYRRRYHALKSSNDTVTLSKRVLRMARDKLMNDFEIVTNRFNYNFVKGAMVLDRNKEFVK